MWSDDGQRRVSCSSSENESMCFEIVPWVEKVRLEWRLGSSRSWDGCWSSPEFRRRFGGERNVKSLFVWVNCEGLCVVMKSVMRGELYGRKWRSGEGGELYGGIREDEMKKWRKWGVMAIFVGEEEGVGRFYGEVGESGRLYFRKRRVSCKTNWPSIGHR